MEKDLKQNLLKDLCCRLPYGVVCRRNDGANIQISEIDIKNGKLNYTDDVIMRDIKPYLRPLSSMTEEERKEYNHSRIDKHGNWTMHGLDDYCYEHHFDFRGLIPMGLALEAPEGMYNIKTTCDNCENNSRCSKSEYVRSHCWRLE